MQQIKRGIYYEDGFLGVTLGALVFTHGTILIDAPLRPEDARSWRSSLLNQRGGSSRLLITLDTHLDRTLGSRALETTVLAHQKTANTFRNRPLVFKGQSFESGAEWELYPEAIGTRWAPPDITFSDRLQLHWGGDDVVLEHRPGPAPGAIWVILPVEQVVYVGDAVAPNQPPFLANADIPEWLETLEALRKEFKNYTVVSGRGGPIAHEDIRWQIRYLKKVVSRLDKLGNKNAPPEEAANLTNGLLSEFSVDDELLERFRLRLESGLAMYFRRQYRPKEVIETDEAATEEED
jgi:glyoxylase-like metal-dependent hydrolase (beta-lactamase superfamily II)